MFAAFPPGSKSRVCYRREAAERKKIVLPNDNAEKSRAGDHENFRRATKIFPAGDWKITAGSQKTLPDRLEQFRATLATYRRHGWQLARALMTQQALGELRRETLTEAINETPPRDATAQDAQSIFEGAPVSESDFDAMWFRRAAAGGREAWELRLAAEAYALFELFEADEAEEDREDVRRELEQRVRERAGGSAS